MIRFEFKNLAEISNRLGAHPCDLFCNSSVVVGIDEGGVEFDGTVEIFDGADLIAEPDENFADPIFKPGVFCLFLGRQFVLRQSAGVFACCLVFLGVSDVRVRVDSPNSYVRTKRV